MSSLSRFLRREATMTAPVMYLGAEITCERDKRNTTHKRLHVYFDKQNGRCFYCWKKCFVRCGYDDTFDPLRATMDHKRPRALGGTNDNNLVMSCAGCNNKKADLPMYVFLAPTFKEAV